jgi:bacteriocin-like protein
MKTEENKKQEELNDEQLDNVSGGGEFTSYDISDRLR